MAIGTQNDFKIYQEQFNGGMVEKLTQVSDAFNAASNNTLRIVPRNIRGQYEQTSFFKLVAGAVTRRDPTSTTSVTPLALQQDELATVKVNRKIGPVTNTLDSFRKIGQAGDDDQTLSFLLGGQFAKAVQVDYLNTLLISMCAGLNGQTALKYQIPTSGTLNTAGLISGLSNFGDNAGEIACWVMHSKAYFDLVQNQITANIPGVSNFNVATASPVTMNRPVIITDSPALVTDNGASPGVAEYLTLGLVAGAGTITQSEDTVVASQLTLGNENITVTLQGEYAYNVGLAGFKWDITNGGANPTNSALGTPSNWDSAMASVKDLAGVIIRSR